MQQLKIMKQPVKAPFKSTLLLYSKEVHTVCYEFKKIRKKAPVEKLFISFTGITLCGTRSAFEISISATDIHIFK